MSESEERDHDEMPIGAFARRTGLTPSALRFYGESGLLTPVRVDDATGYRFYDADQTERGVLLRRLREIGVSLVDSRAVLDAETVTAAGLVEAHVRDVEQSTLAMRVRSADIIESLNGFAETAVVTISGPALAAAMDQVASATVRDQGLPVLDAVHMTVADDEITVAATDRYRLAIRTVAVLDRVHRSWSGTLAAEDLRTGLAQLRRSARVELRVAERRARLCVANGAVLDCRLLDVAFPDYRAMVADLAPVTTSVIVEAARLVRAVEAIDSERIQMRTDEATLVVAGDSVPATAHRLSARTSGASLDIWFDITTVHPGLVSTAGAEVLLEFRGAAQPLTITSADSGDLTTVVMPIGHSN
ncbi:MerR family transcriptional regulator [Gordonia soli]|uniref:Putative MerR family transcriptional regulator n=1 Tax=Gordonia soli NBRC 108243 TaxID=1223545 RepID=M0QK74_9ACTN|nr:MerR family transcriptional regulator [Gordonia soli]GAC68943.1 putative MerR family transcriptional regulator [Gordonia soli NBRC 108243]